jgi:hypothetical protein
MSKPKGRTIFEILSGRNKPDNTPLELKHYNPLTAKVGCTISIDNDPALSGTYPVIEKICVYETTVNNKKFYHTDYCLKAVTLSQSQPIFVKLRVIPDSNTFNKLGCKLQLLSLYTEMGWDKDFHDAVLNNGTGILDVNQDDEGNPLETPRRYWRCEGVTDPYHCQVTVLSDKDGDGKVEEEELERYPVMLWDYHREIEEYTVKHQEFLAIEMVNKTKYFMFYRGREVSATEIQII